MTKKLLLTIWLIFWLLSFSYAEDSTTSWTWSNNTVQIVDRNNDWVIDEFEKCAFVEMKWEDACRKNPMMSWMNMMKDMMKMMPNMSWANMGMHMEKVKEMMRWVPDMSWANMMLDKAWMMMDKMKNMMRNVPNMSGMNMMLSGVNNMMRNMPVMPMKPMRMLDKNLKEKFDKKIDALSWDAKIEFINKLISRIENVRESVEKNAKYSKFRKNKLLETLDMIEWYLNTKLEELGANTNSSDEENVINEILWN